MLYDNITVGHAFLNTTKLVVPRNSTAWMPTVQMSVDLSAPGMFGKVAELVERMLAHGVAPIGVRGNFTFGSGGLRFSPRRYHQLAVPGCIQLPEAARHSCPAETEPARS